jgi:hypothetical protein
MRHTYENSAGSRRNPERPPRRVGWGPRSTDEMGDLWLQVLTRTEQDRIELARHFQGNWRPSPSDARPAAVRVYLTPSSSTSPFMA